MAAMMGLRKLCRECNGKGYVIIRTPYQAIKRKCNRCNGSGWEEMKDKSESK